MDSPAKAAAPEVRFFRVSSYALPRHNFLARRDPCGAAVILAGLDLLPCLHPEKHLSLMEQAKASRFWFRRDRERCRLAHTLKRLALADPMSLAPHDLIFHQDQGGKPSLSHSGRLEFSLSHAGSWAAIAIAQSPCGVDLEPMASAEFRSYPVEAALHPKELNEWDRSADPDAYFLRIWTGKEALSKALGLGLSMDFRSFSLIDRLQAYSLLHLQLPAGLHLSMALKGKLDWMDCYFVTSYKETADLERLPAPENLDLNLPAENVIMMSHKFSRRG